MKKLFLLFLCCLILPFDAFGASNARSNIVVRKKNVRKEANVNIALPAVTPVPFRIPEVQRVVTDNGIEAWLIEEKSTPVIAVSLIFKGGKTSDPQRLTGLSSLAASLMDEGAGPYKAEEFSELLQENAISVSFHAYADTISAGLKTLRKNKEKAFDLLRLSLCAPPPTKSMICSTRLKTPWTSTNVCW